MPRQHFLGAAFLGGFSLDRTDPARGRSLWARRRPGIDDAYQTNADSVAWRRDIFTTTDAGAGAWDPLTVDRHLGMTDPRIAAAIDRLVKGTLSPREWISTLVPFVATLFVRNPEFGPRFMRRLGDPPPELAMGHADNTNTARVAEMQRLLSPVMRADWALVLNRSNVPLITSDLGYTPMTDLSRDRWGYAIPVRIDAALVIVAPGPESPASRQAVQPQATRIVRSALGTDEVRSLNSHVAIVCRSEVYGATREVVEAVDLTGPPIEIPDPAAGLIILPGFDLRQHEQDWIHVIGAISDEWAEP